MLKHDNSNPFWQFSLANYQLPEVEKTCLKLQNEFNFNINITLFCCWLGSNNQIISQDFIESLCEYIHDWDDIVQSIRNLRIKVKQYQSINEPYHTFYPSIKQLELTAEEIEQHNIYVYYSEQVTYQMETNNSSLSTTIINITHYWLYLKKVNSVMPTNITTLPELLIMLLQPMHTQMTKTEIAEQINATFSLNEAY